MARQLRKTPVLNLTTTEEKSVVEVDTNEPSQKRKTLISGKIRTMNTMVVKKFTWMQKLVTMVGGQPAIYA